MAGSPRRVSCDTFRAMSLRLHILLVRLSNNEHDVHVPPGRIGSARRVRSPVRPCARRPPSSRRGARLRMGQARSLRVPPPLVRPRCLGDRTGHRLRAGRRDRCLERQLVLDSRLGVQERVRHARRVLRWRGKRPVGHDHLSRGPGRGRPRGRRCDDRALRRGRCDRGCDVDESLRARGRDARADRHRGPARRTGGLRHGRPRREPQRDPDGRDRRRHRRSEADGHRRSPGRDRWPGAGRVRATRVRVDRPGLRHHHSDLVVRLRACHGSADRRGVVRRRHRRRSDHAAVERHLGAGLRRHPGSDDRHRCRHRLCALHRHPVPRGPEGGPRSRAVDGGRTRHRRACRRLRRLHGRDLVAGHVHHGPVVHQRTGHRRRRHGARDDDRLRDPAARAARIRPAQDRSVALGAE